GCPRPDRSWCPHTASGLWGRGLERFQKVAAAGPEDRRSPQWLRGIPAKEAACHVRTPESDRLHRHNALSMEAIGCTKVGGPSFALAAVGINVRDKNARDSVESWQTLAGAAECHIACNPQKARRPHRRTAPPSRVAAPGKKQNTSAESTDR